MFLLYLDKVVTNMMQLFFKMSFSFLHTPFILFVVFLFFITISYFLKNKSFSKILNQLAFISLGVGCVISIYAAFICWSIMQTKHFMYALDILPNTRYAFLIFCLYILISIVGIFMFVRKKRLSLYFILICLIFAIPLLITSNNFTNVYYKYNLNKKKPSYGFVAKMNHYGFAKQ